MAAIAQNELDEGEFRGEDSVKGLYFLLYL
jgi:hypothetical protein